jgi:hypothetical protein
MTANQIWALGGSAIAAVAVVAGLYVAGAPSEERALRLDERRVEDLMTLTRAVDSYRLANGALPQNLDQVIAGQRLRNVPVDPVSGHPYTYEISDNDSYHLCAEFSRPSRSLEPTNFWGHQAGRQCFEMDVADAD